MEGRRIDVVKNSSINGPATPVLLLLDATLVGIVLVNVGGWWGVDTIHMGLNT
jgi:hypothetical protein